MDLFLAFFAGVFFSLVVIVIFMAIFSGSHGPPNKWPDPPGDLPPPPKPPKPPKTPRILK